MKEVMAESTVIGQNKRQHMEHLKANGGYFKKFEWIEDPFELKEETDKALKRDAKIREVNLHPQPFNANQNKKLLKFEYPF
jgi:hypothetical protein|tara:strand:+ start:491 stop:733 length:243 start_codon:yes stop_codon:yes gene_type:complete